MKKPEFFPASSPFDNKLIFGFFSPRAFSAYGFMDSNH
jgi:hypothetical protein